MRGEPALSGVVSFEDEATGMVLIRTVKNMEGERYAANLVVNPLPAFRPETLRYRRFADVWLLVGTPRGARKGTLAVQSVLYKKFRPALRSFRAGTLQRAWRMQQEILRAKAGR